MGPALGRGAARGAADFLAPPAAPAAAAAPPARRRRGAAAAARARRRRDLAFGATLFQARKFRAKRQGAREWRRANPDDRSRQLRRLQYGRRR
jgi:hypothetical protein